MPTLPNNDNKEESNTDSKPAAARDAGAAKGASAASREDKGEKQRVFVLLLPYFLLLIVR